MVPLSYAIYTGMQADEEAKEAAIYRPEKYEFLNELPPEKDLLNYEFSRVRLSGTFDNANEILLGTRPNVSSRGFHSVIDKRGYYVLTPFTLDDGRRVLVNRGWISTTTKKNGHQRLVGQVEGRTTITCYIVNAEEKVFAIVCFLAT